MGHIQLRIDDDEKEAVREILESMGLNFSSAVKLFFKKTIQLKKLPFEIVADKTIIPVKKTEIKTFIEKTKIEPIIKTEIKKEKEENIKKTPATWNAFTQRKITY